MMETDAGRRGLGGKDVEGEARLWAGALSRSRQHLTETGSPVLLLPVWRGLVMNSVHEMPTVKRPG